ncbi:hypothetical protein [Actinomadura sp. SCN-SB]|uniref:hypothetical protein n=1 Tax=Actinomadura sp. SCN-SB TaxID=3373092 RepID=UPI003750B477
MNRIENYIRDRHAEAIDARGDAEGELVAAIDGGEAIAAEVRAVAQTRAVAGWWERVLTQIDQGGADPCDALWRQREAAHRAQLDHPTPRAACPFSWSFAAASIEGARHFYCETAHVQALTTITEASLEKDQGQPDTTAASKEESNS